LTCHVTSPMVLKGLGFNLPLLIKQVISDIFFPASNLA